MPSGQFKQAKAENLLRAYMSAIYGQGEWVKYFGKQQIYFDHILIEDSKLSISDVQQKAMNFIIQLSGVSNVLSSSIMQSTNFTDGTYRKMLNSFNQKRSGDIMFTLEPGWIEHSMTESTLHNSPHGYDSHIPLIWYGWKLDRKTITREVSITDIASTISTLLDIPEPSVNTGVAIWEIMPEH
mgnify:CR=1 FL=1